jgi:hypothetical protein
MLAICSARLRAGPIALAIHLQRQFDTKADSGGSSNLPEEIDGKHRALVFMRSLALQLRRMGSEFPPAKRGRRATK